MSKRRPCLLLLAAGWLFAALAVPGQEAAAVASFDVDAATAIDEWIFYSHPSGRARVHMAMQWKAENPAELRARRVPAAAGEQATPGVETRQDPTAIDEESQAMPEGEPP